MHQFIRNIRLSRKLFLLLLFPLAALTWFVAGFVAQQLSTLHQMKELVQSTRLASDVSDVVTLLQQERGASGIFLASKGNAMRQELTQIRQQADAAISAIQHNHTQQQLDTTKALTELGNIGVLRQSVEAQAINGAESGRRYTVLIGDLLHITQRIELSVTDLDAARALATLNQFSAMKERAGRERAIVGGVFSANSAGLPQLHRFAENSGEFAAFSAMFHLTATAAQQERYQRRMQHQSVAQVDKMKALLLETPPGDALNTSGSEWFAKATERINEMAVVEHELVSEVEAYAQQRYQQAIWALLVSLAVVIIGLLLVAAITYFIIRNMKQAVSSVTATLQQLAAGNLNAQSTYQGRDEFGQIATELNTMRQGLKQVMTDIAQVTIQVTTAAEQSSAVTLQTSQGMQRQLQDTEAVVTAMHEMGTTVRDVASNTAQAAEMSRTADQNAEQGQQQVEAALLLIRELAEQADRTAQTVDYVKNESNNITGVLDVIGDIAEQTNLLALNAAIEAARAGDHGRGFAVVATEVRTLAQRTQQSTGDIQGMIQRLQSGADNAQQAMQLSLQQAAGSVDNVARVGQFLAEIVLDIGAINDMNTQIASAAEQQNTVVEDINRSLSCINDVALQTSAGAEQTAASSAQLANLAENLQQHISRFRV